MSVQCTTTYRSSLFARRSRITRVSLRTLQVDNHKKSKNSCKRILFSKRTDILSYRTLCSKRAGGAWLSNWQGNRTGKEIHWTLSSIAKILYSTLCIEITIIMCDISTSWSPLYLSLIHI